MGNLISRQAAIDIANRLICPLDEYHQYNQAINNYVAELVQLPSAQPEVIYCKDCAHNIITRPNAGNACCELYDGMYDLYGYCHEGERRQDE